MQNVLSYCWLSGNVNIETFGVSFALCCVWTWNWVSDCKGWTEAEGSDAPRDMFLSPSLPQHLCTTQCTLNHSSVTAANHFGDLWQLPQAVPSNCKFFSIHQMPANTDRPFGTRTWTPPHVGAVTDTWFGVNMCWLISGDRLRVLKNTPLKGIFGHKGGEKVRESWRQLHNAGLQECWP